MREKIFLSKSDIVSLLCSLYQYSFFFKCWYEESSVDFFRNCIEVFLLTLFQNFSKFFWILSSLFRRVDVSIKIILSVFESVEGQEWLETFENFS
jgi:hypothetical protein